METITDRVIIGLKLKQYYFSNNVLNGHFFIQRRTTYGFEIDFYKGIPLIIFDYLKKFSYFISFPENANFNRWMCLNKIKMLVEMERYWEIHNILESFWKRKIDPEKLFLKGVIDICVSQVKVQMGQSGISKKIMTRGELEIKQSGLSKYIVNIMDRKEYPARFTNLLLLNIINHIQ